ncbi:MAG: hypothetical protein K5868_02705 [Lachnospiraceae bacterium]|nr:hypothetical protein [Lachnospiraceae bacterium]
MKLIRKRRVQNIILSLAAAIVLYGALALFFDFYYDLNDDVMIKDILAGIYTGRPDAHNNQMLYPISALIAGLYRTNSGVPWFGLFEIICMVVSFVLITFRVLLTIDRSDLCSCENEADSDNDSSKETACLGRTVIIKVLCTLFLMILFAGLMMWELVNIQYTVVAGVLTVAAAVMLYTGDSVGVSDDKKDSKGEYRATVFELKTFVRMNIPSIILAVIAFNIRSELVLLLSPILAAVAIAKWSEESRKQDAYVICGYLGVFLFICLLMLCSLGIDRAAYSSPEWKEYRRFFDMRTELYDFTGVPDYEDNKSFYDSAGISEEQVKLLKGYNYYLDDSIDADMLKKITDGVKSGRATGRSTYGKSIREAIWEYIHNLKDWDIDYHKQQGVSTEDNIFIDESMQHKPFNVIIFILYIEIIAVSYLVKDKSAIIKIPSFIILRTIPWLFVYLKGRVLSRITHPLYITEIVILLCILLRAVLSYKASTDADMQTKRVVNTMGAISVIVITMLCLSVIPLRTDALMAAGQAREEINKEAVTLYDHTSTNPDTYYYIDTYSTVDFTEKMFGVKRITKKNTQLLGGWMGNSPLDTYKRSLCSSEEIITRDKYLALTENGK